MKIQHRQAIQWLLIATLFWGISFPVMRALSKIQASLIPSMSSWTFTAIIVAFRFAISALIIALFDLKNILKITRREFSQGLGLGIFGALGIILQMDALYYTEASTSAFLTQSYCIWIPAFFILKSRKLPPIELIASTVLVICGIATLSKLELNHLRFGRGEWETIVASIFFAGQILWLERPSYARNKTGPATFAMFVVMVLTALPMALSKHGAHLENWTILLGTAPLSLILVLTIFCTLLPFLLMNYWQKFVKAAEAGLIYCIEPIFAAIFAGFLPGFFSRLFRLDYPNEGLSPRLVVGGVLITAANLLLQLSKYQKRRKN